MTVKPDSLNLLRFGEWLGSSPSARTAAPWDAYEACQIVKCHFWRPDVAHKQLGISLLNGFCCMVLPQTRAWRARPDLNSHHIWAPCASASSLPAQGYRVALQMNPSLWTALLGKSIHRYDDWAKFVHVHTVLLSFLPSTLFGLVQAFVYTVCPKVPRPISRLVMIALRSNLHWKALPKVTMTDAMHANSVSKLYSNI